MLRKTLTTPVQEELDPDVNRSYVYLCAVVAAVGGFIFGYDLSIVSGALIFLREEFGLSGLREGYAVSSALLGCLTGPFFAGWMADKIGRKRTLIIAAILFGLSAIGTAIPRTLEQFISFRILGGVGVGLASVISPMYIAEIAPARIRGSLVTVNQLMIVIGSVCSIIVSYFLAAGGHWRWMFASEMVPITALVIGLLFAPETPRWLVLKRRDQEALDLLRKIDGRRHAENEIIEIRQSFAADVGHLRDLLLPGIRFALLVAVMIALFQQITGMSAMTFYFPVIFQMAGYEEAQAAIGMNVIVNIFQIAMTFLAFWLVDRLGRRFLLLTGTACMVIGFTMIGFVFYREMGGIWVLLAILVGNGGYLISLAPLGWLIMSEIFPNRLRGRGMGVCAVILWGSAFLTTWLFPQIRDLFEQAYGTPAGTFWLFAGISLLAFLFGLFFVPETKKQTLEAIGNAWEAKAQEETGRKTSKR